MQPPIVVDGKELVGPLGASPTWNLAADGRTAYLIQMSDPTLFEIDLLSEGEVVEARSHGKMIEGNGFDSRAALSIGPDGRVYAVVRIDNQTGFGGGFLHHHHGLIVTRDGTVYVTVLYPFTLLKIDADAYRR